MSSWLGNLLKEARLTVGQTVEGMAVLSNVSPEEYAEFEEGVVPPEETLQKLCYLLQWNYHDIQKGIRSQASLNKGITPRGTSSSNADDSLGEFSAEKSLGDVMREVRIKAGGTLESVAVLLNISSRELEEIEGGKSPGEPLLRKIATVFQWNFNDLQQLLKKESLKGLDFSKITLGKASNVQFSKIRTLCQEIAKNSENTLVPTNVIEAQLELILGTLKKLS